MSSLPHKPYRIPTVLRDLQLVDLLELTGSTTASAAQIGLSQPSVSRRYRALAADLGLQRLPGYPIGKRYGHTPWLQLLRQGIKSHRLACGWPPGSGILELETSAPWAQPLRTWAVN